MDTKQLHADATRIEHLLREGQDEPHIRALLPHASALSYDAARAKLTNSRKKHINPDYLFLQDDLRFCTNPHVAEHRAKTLACARLIDVGCGIGVQSIAFARTCTHVIAIDIDPRKIAFAQHNSRTAGVNNITFIAGNALDILPALLPCDVLFWDPARPAEEKRRSLESLQPPFNDMLALASKSTTFVAELPPRLLHVATLPAGRTEYLSVRGKLNRTQLVIPGDGIMVTSLPRGDTLTRTPSPRTRPLTAPQRYLYVIDTGILQAKMIDTLAQHTGIRSHWAHYLTSDTLVHSPFLEPFEVHKISSRKNAESDLGRLRAGRIRLRGRIEPAEHNRLKSTLERGLKGDLLIDCFVHESQIVLATPHHS